MQIFPFFIQCFFRNTSVNSNQYGLVDEHMIFILLHECQQRYIIKANLLFEQNKHELQQVYIMRPLSTTQALLT